MRSLRVLSALAPALIGLSMIVLPAGPVAAEGPIGTNGGPVVNFPGCIAFQHINFGGAKFTVHGNTDVSYTGSRWNDQISSIACNSYCTLTAWEHRDFKGRSHVFTPNISFVGSFWNDRISSFKVRCRRR